MNRTVLVVEDEGQLREVVVEALGDLGYRILVAADGHEAVRILQGPEPIDLLFTDVTMPNGLSGVDVAVSAAELRPELRVLLVSGYAKGQLPPFPDHAHFIQKPYRMSQLLSKFKELWGE